MLSRANANISLLSLLADETTSDVVMMQLLDREVPVSVRTQWRDSLVAAST